MKLYIICVLAKGVGKDVQRARIRDLRG